VPQSAPEVLLGRSQRTKHSLRRYRAAPGGKIAACRARAAQFFLFAALLKPCWTMQLATLVHARASASLRERDRHT
jgi:hypothetical protein